MELESLLPRINSHLSQKNYFKHKGSSSTWILKYFSKIFQSCPPSYLKTSGYFICYQHSQTILTFGASTQQLFFSCYVQHVIAHQLYNWQTIQNENECLLQVLEHRLFNKICSSDPNLQKLSKGRWIRQGSENFISTRNESQS